MTDFASGGLAAAAGALASAHPVPGDGATVRQLQAWLGVAADGSFGPASRAALFARLGNRRAPALTEVDLARAAVEIDVPIGHIRGVIEVETAGRSYDEQGRPRILFERHYFHRLTGGRYSAAYPSISNSKSGGYGPSSAQYDRLAAACALDPGAAFRSASWGAFQVMGAHAAAPAEECGLGYSSALAMALAMVAGEAAHLDSFVRFVRANALADELRACRAGDPASCVPFVRRYNGAGYAKNDYHRKLARAIG